MIFIDVTYGKFPFKYDKLLSIVAYDKYSDINIPIYFVSFVMKKKILYRLDWLKCYFFLVMELWIKL